MCVSSRPGYNFSIWDRPGSAPIVKHEVFEHRWRLVEAKRLVLDKICVSSKRGGVGTHRMLLFIDQYEKKAVQLYVFFIQDIFEVSNNERTHCKMRCFCTQVAFWSKRNGLFGTKFAFRRSGAGGGA